MRTLALLLIAALSMVRAAEQTITSEQAAAEAFLFTPAGFDREGQPMWTSGDQTGQLQIVVRDAATGRITPCRINVVGPDGNYYQPLMSCFRSSISSAIRSSRRQRRSQKPRRRRFFGSAPSSAGDTSRAAGGWRRVCGP